MHWLDATFFVVTLIGLFSCLISVFTYCLEPRVVNTFAIFFFWVGLFCCGGGLVWMLIRKPFLYFVFGVELP